MRPDLEPAALLQRLRDLPDAPPPYDFSEFSHRYSRRGLRRTQRPLRLLAAAVAVVVAGWVVKDGLVPLITDVSSVAEVPGLPMPPPDIPPGVHWPVLLPTVNAESWLNEHPRRALVGVPAQIAVIELEDQIATMDDQLNAVRLSRSHPQQLALMQRDRAQMIESLAQVRYAQNLVAGLP
jgi:hypothetical protein